MGSHDHCHVTQTFQLTLNMLLEHPLNAVAASLGVWLKVSGVTAALPALVTATLHQAGFMMLKLANKL